MAFMPPPGPPPGSTGQQGPVFPPPPFEPPISAFAVDPRAISRCLHRNTFVWLTNGNRFWFYPIFVGGFSVTGYWWTGRFWMPWYLALEKLAHFHAFKFS